jgi:hypothetical protein
MINDVNYSTSLFFLAIDQKCSINLAGKKRFSGFFRNQLKNSALPGDVAILILIFIVLFRVYFPSFTPLLG